MGKRGYISMCQERVGLWKTCCHRHFVAFRLAEGRADYLDVEIEQSRYLRCRIGSYLRQGMCKREKEIRWVLIKGRMV